MFSKEYHIGLGVDDIGKYVLITEDSKRVEKIAGFLDKSFFLATNREFNSFAGYLEGERVIVISSGLGGPSTAVAVEELSRLGVHIIIRIGTCTSIQPYIKNGALVIPFGVVRDGKTCHDYLPPEYPAVPHPEVFQALFQTAQKIRRPVHIGITHSKDAFFKEEPEKMPDSEGVKNYWKILRKANVLSSEMQCDTLFILSSLRGIKAGAIFSAIGSVEGMPIGEVAGIDAAIQVAVDALRLLITQEKKAAPHKEDLPGMQF